MEFDMHPMLSRAHSVRGHLPSAPATLHASPSTNIWNDPLHRVHHSHNRLRQFRETQHFEEHRNPDTGNIQINNYEVCDKLGQGSFGEVYRCINLEALPDEEREYAVKVIQRKSLMKASAMLRGPPKRGQEAPLKPPNPLEALYSEIAIMKKLQHENICQIVEVMDDPSHNKIYLVMELCRGGESLKMEPNAPCDPLGLDKSRAYIRDMIQGLLYLHSNKIVHRDIKPENCLLADDGFIKITDFGVSVIITESSNDIVTGTKGTPHFMAPELCSGGAVHGFKTDVWALGVTLYCFVYGRLPFPVTETGHRATYKLMEDIQHNEVVYHPDIQIPETLQDLFNRLLEKDPEKRISLKETALHPWVTDNGASVIADVKSEKPIVLSEHEVKYAFSPVRRSYSEAGGKMESELRKKEDGPYLAPLEEANAVSSFNTTG